MASKRAVFVCGSGGSGKTTFVNKYFSNFIQINLDIIYERLLIENGLGLDIKNFNTTEMELSIQLFDESKKLNDELFFESIKTNSNIVIDGIGRHSDIILNQRNLLNREGYDTALFMLYADLNVCIERVEQRNRRYDQQLTIDSWYMAYSNMVDYKKEFKNDFYFIHNENKSIDTTIKQFMEVTKNRILLI